jgi:predicted transcriptional regulator
MAESQAKPVRFYETMTDAQRADLGQSITEANAGRIVEQDEFDAELDALFAKRA